MIGLLPKTLTINNRELPIDSNFKTALLCMEIANDPDLDEQSKGKLLIDIIIGLEKLKPEEYEEASQKVAWFLDGGKNLKKAISTKKLMDWEQDEQMIFSSVNKVAGIETREKTYIHWWTWLGYFSETGDGLFSTIVSIRQKRNTGKRLTKEEQEFYNKNKELIDIKPKYTEEEQQEIDELNKSLG